MTLKHKQANILMENCQENENLYMTTGMKKQATCAPVEGRRCFMTVKTVYSPNDRQILNLPLNFWTMQSQIFKIYNKDW